MYKSTLGEVVEAFFLLALATPHYDGDNPSEARYIRSIPFQLPRKKGPNVFIKTSRKKKLRIQGGIVLWYFAIISYQNLAGWCAVPYARNSFM